MMNKAEKAMLREVRAAGARAAKVAASSHALYLAERSQRHIAEERATDIAGKIYIMATKADSDQHKLNRCLGWIDNAMGLHPIDENIMFANDPRREKSPPAGETVVKRAWEVDDE